MNINIEVNLHAKGNIFYRVVVFQSSVHNTRMIQIGQLQLPPMNGFSRFKGNTDLVRISGKKVFLTEIIILRS